MFLSEDTVHAFAKARHDQLSFPFLKENGELLSLASTTQMLMEPQALEHYKPFYKSAVVFNTTYPQYFRFTWRICLDLEDLGMSGDVGATLSHYVRDNDLLAFDISDTRRLETLNLLGRKFELNASERGHQLRLLDNIERFTCNPEHFTRLNKPFFYELTHTIFFLTEYGDKPWPVSAAVITCLNYMGVLAFLDNDCDLLAEICLCYHYLGRECPPLWNQKVDESLAGIEISYGTDIKSALNAATDEYHPYIVMNWRNAQLRQPCFTEKFRGRRPNFVLSGQGDSILSKLCHEIHITRFENISPALAQERFHAGLSKTERGAIDDLKTIGPFVSHILEHYSFH